MTHAEMNRSMAEAIVRRSLYGIQTDPKRTIRNLVDLGRETASGPLQQKFLGIAQQMLRQKDSPYYALVQDTVRRVDAERLMAFGMNLGWNSLTQGARTIRAEEARRGHNIPWALTLRMARWPGSLTGGDYLRLVLEGMELGIYSYFLLPRDQPSVTRALELAAASRDCAFCLLLPREADARLALGSRLVSNNLLVGLDTAAPAWQEQANWLRAKRMHYLLYRHYAAAGDVEEILTGVWARQIMPWAGVAALLVAAPDAGDQAGAAVYDYAVESRLRQRYPTLMLDFYRDCLYADRCISGDGCFVGLLSDGTVTEYRGGCETPTDASFRRTPLGALLSRFVKTQQAG